MTGYVWPAAPCHRPRPTRRARPSTPTPRSRPTPKTPRPRQLLHLPLEPEQHQAHQLPGVQRRQLQPPIEGGGADRGLRQRPARRVLGGRSRRQAGRGAARIPTGRARRGAVPRAGRRSLNHRLERSRRRGEGHVGGSRQAVRSKMVVTTSSSGIADCRASAAPRAVRRSGRIQCA